MGVCIICKPLRQFILVIICQCLYLLYVYFQRYKKPNFGIFSANFALNCLYGNYSWNLILFNRAQKLHKMAQFCFTTKFCCRYYVLNLQNTSHNVEGCSMRSNKLYLSEYGHQWMKNLSMFMETFVNIHTNFIEICDGRAGYFSKITLLDISKFNVFTS